MASGWAKDGAVQDQIDASVAEAVQRARNQLGGESASECETCGEDIPEARRKALPGVHRCVSCQELYDAEQQDLSPYNRRGNKDSQLR
jgi:phage/conjugal plasmid C-4 type zinc finger TraR family protein